MGRLRGISNKTTKRFEFWLKSIKFEFFFEYFFKYFENVLIFYSEKLINCKYYVFLYLVSLMSANEHKKSLSLPQSIY